MPQLGGLIFGFIVILPFFLSLLVRFIYVVCQQEKYTQLDGVLAITFSLLFTSGIVLKDYSM